MKRGLIISNCQAQPLKHALSLFCKDLPFDSFSIHLLEPSEREKAISEFVKRSQKSYDVVLSIPLSNDFGLISSNSIRSTFNNSVVALIPNFYFSGLHPDLTYAGTLSQRITGPLGDYHSKLAAYGYVSGLTVSHTVDLFCDSVYRELEYYDEYHKSLKDLKAREELLDIPFIDELSVLLKKDLCFFSVNHPTGFLISAFCSKAANWLHERGVCLRTDWLASPSSIGNELAMNAIFPIFPEIATAHGINFSGNYLFKPPSNANNAITCLDLEEFVEREFRSFLMLGLEELTKAPQISKVIRYFEARLARRRIVATTNPVSFPAATATAKQQIERPIEMTMGLRIDLPDPLVRCPDGHLMLNVAGLLEPRNKPIHEIIDGILKQAVEHARQADRELRPNTSMEPLNDDLLPLIGDLRLSEAAVDRIRDIVAHFTVQTKQFNRTEWLPGKSVKLNLPSQRRVLRYGPVELRVVENYLSDPEGLRIALSTIIPMLDNEDEMYRPGRPKNHLSADDIAWNLRTLMTNAGFYIQPDVNAAWDVLTSWAERYISALRHGWLATFPPAYSFYFQVQRILWQRYRASPRYVSHPDVFEVYRALEGQRVLVVSPLADQINAQASSGRLWKLYQNRQVPKFNVRAIRAAVSTWPNRPGVDWAQTFFEMCQLVDAAFRDQQFDVLVAVCGCYGLPICEYASSTYDVKSLYLGNITHAYFGIRQRATERFMIDEANPEMWLQGDLGRYQNIERIDGGRYL